MAIASSTSISFSNPYSIPLPNRSFPPSNRFSFHSLSSPFRSRLHHVLRAARNAPLDLTIRSVNRPKAQVVTKESWNKVIIESKTPVLVEFYASWCGPCRMVHRVIDEIAVDYAGKLECFVLNTDNDLKIAEEYEIKAVPVVMLFKNGEKCDSVVGTMPKDFYIAAIEKVLKQ